MTLDQLLVEFDPQSEPRIYAAIQEARERADKLEAERDYLRELAQAPARWKP